MITKRYLILFFCCCFSQSLNYLFAQTYLKASANPNANFNQKIALFENGDVLIGDSSIEPLKSGDGTGLVQLSRLDNCGTIVWSYNYKISDGYVEFKDFAINEEEEIFLYGSFYVGLSESIFLTKVDGRTGMAQDYQIFNPGTVDHFSYSIDARNGQVMIYGLRHGFQTQKEGFVAVFNENLIYQWGKFFTPFESSGNAMISADNGLVGWSGTYFFKLSQEGDLQWMQSITSSLFSDIVRGPLEVADGYIFEANSEGNGFFFKVNANGQLIWKTALLIASNIGGALSLLPDGAVLATYNRPINNTGQLCQVHINGNGQIIQQRKLSIDKSLNLGNLYQVIDQNQITIAGNNNPFNTTQTDLKDFILQFSLDKLDDACLLWEPFDEVIPNELPINLQTQEVEIVDFQMALERRLKAKTSIYDPSLIESCDIGVNIDNQARDTVLNCDTKFWEVTLPEEDFFWLDGTEESIRQLDQPGVYYAKNRSCINPIDLSFTLNKENCGCLVYLPNAFSPNEDGINDQLTFHTDCIVNQIEMRVFNRWGDQVFYSQQVDHFWDGIFQGKKAPADVYIALIKYGWTDFDGQLQEDILFQEINLVN